MSASTGWSRTGYTNASYTSGFTRQDWATRDTGIIKGVCARISERAGVPAWMPRVAFVIFFMLHWFFAALLYFVLSRLMCRGQMLAAAPMAASAPPSPVRDRFGALDRRLADLEAATLQQESNLRRAFRDLERG
jgi:phage shock protein PspC (stress-responsive transcriptional regulator)